MLKVEQLDFAYGEVGVLRDVHLDVEAGRIHCLMGRNGVGKTTLVGTIIGHLRPRRGRISLQGCDVTAEPAHKRVRGGIALVPQGRQIFPKLTVEENLRVALASVPGGGRDVPAEIYGYFPVLGEMRRRRGGDLSGGQQQQLAIGRALVTNPKVLVLDEPTEGIQPNIIQHIGALLRRLVAERGLTVLIVEQYLDFVREYGHRFSIMNRGAIVASGTTAELDDGVVERFLSV
jgi:urea transport system ATP-binding protein